MDDGTLVAVVPVVPREEFSKERRATHILLWSAVLTSNTRRGGGVFNA